MNVVAMTLRAVQIARSWGLKVTFEPGWETRGNGQAANYVGVSIHHTATPSSVKNPFPTRRMLRDGRSDLPGPLCNSAGPADGSIHIMAAYPANHAGASGGKSMGPLPTTGLFNPRSWGHEIDYAGTVPMLTAQYRSAALMGMAVLQALKEHGQIPTVDIERVRAHAETSITGKWDPGDAPGRTINMAAFRKYAVTTAKEDDMPTAAEVASAILNTKITRQGSKLGGTVTLGQMLAWYDAGVERDAARDAATQAAVTALAKNPAITPAMLSAEVDKAVDKHTASAADIAAAIDVAQRPHIQAAVRAVLGEDNADQADRIVDELVARLADPKPPEPVG